MKTYLTIILLLLPAPLFAQNYGTISKGDMQKVQECMANIDQTKLSELQNRSEAAKQKIDALCAQGNRDKAQKEALAFGKQIASDPTIEQMRKCGKMAEGALPMTGMVETYDEKKYASRHVCDE